MRIEGNKILLKPNRRMVRENLPKNNLRPPYMELTKIKRSWYVVSEKHFDKHGNHNGYLLPIISQDGWIEKTFVWSDHLASRGLTIAK